MKVLWVLTFFITLSNCSSARVYNELNNFIDIEVNSEDAWLGCSDIDLKEPNSLMTFYAVTGDSTHEFMFRRVIDVKRCLKLEKEYQSLVRGAGKVRLVGISPTKNHDSLITDRVPEKFRDSVHTTNWIFVRFQTEKGCESYFEGDCKPEKYWGGVIPGK